MGLTAVAGEPSPQAGYAELHCISNFTFLRGASHPQELVAQAVQLGYTALALTDECSVAGVVRAHVAARGQPIKLLIGSELRLECGLKLVALARDRLGYGKLCSLITRGRRAARKGEYRLTREDMEDHGLAHCFVLWVPGRELEESQVRWAAGLFGSQLRIAVELFRDGTDGEQLAVLTRMGRKLGVPLVASGDVHMHVRARRRLQDVLTAIRLNVPVAEAGWELYPNGERYLRERPRLAGLYPREFLEETLRVAAECSFSLDELRYEYPHEIVPAGETPTTYLRKLAEEGARWRWPGGVPDSERGAIEHELELIADLRYEPFFLTVHDIVNYARGLGILCQGRGSAANSRVCYCLGITAVDPQRGAALLFERFISRERNEPPDIDIDFEHERREEVIQYVYRKYGRHRAALAAAVIMYRPRSALRDVGKALGLDPGECARLTKIVQWWDGGEALPERMREAGFDPESPVMALLLALARELVAFPGFPRHLSQHVGGFVISEGPLCELVPLENAAMPGRTVVQWDKDDLNDLGLIKVDLLALGMLTALKRSFSLVNAYRGTHHALGSLPAEDPAVYEMISAADTIGVFQIESRAQMAMLPRLQPRCYYDLVIEIAIVRPGPIQGDMVHPYLKRRKSGKSVSYPKDEVQKVLERTLGVPIFQEQVMQLAIVAAGFSPGEADDLRRAMGAWKRSGGIEHFKERLLKGMHDHGYEDEFAQRLYRQMLGFGEYGFPECVAGDTRVVDAETGRWVRLDEVASGHARLAMTLACDEELRFKKRKVVALKASGVKPVWRLRTALGHVIVATAEHPFMMVDGWRKLGQLRVGDCVAVARRVAVPGLRRWPRQQVLALADQIAEAKPCHPNIGVKRNKSRFAVRARRLHRTRPGAAVPWVWKLGRGAHGVPEKHLPPEVFELCDANIALLLARLWEGDRSFSKRGHVSYNTTSPRLAHEVQYLLLRLGIAARLHGRAGSCKGRKIEHLVIMITGEEPLRQFWRHVGRHRREFEKRPRSAGHRHARMSRDTLPIAARPIIDRAHAGLVMTRLERSSSSHGLLSSSDVCWDPVVAIEALGEQPTYDLEIEGNHNFLANNLVVHNSHSASFALLAYDSAWLKRHEPAAFTCALLNSQPMGFYAPAQLVRDARAHGVEVRPADVCASDWDCTLERAEDDEPALRLGMRLVRSLSQAGAERVVAARGARSFASIQDLTERAALDRGDLEALAAAGALASLSGNRHLAFWEVAGTERPLPLAPPGTRAGRIEEGQPLLTTPTEAEGIVADYRAVGLTLGRHPMALLREDLLKKGLLSAADLGCVAHGRRVSIAGIVLMRQRPQTASGVTFLTLEDESGQVNVIVWESVSRAHHRALVEARMLEVQGELQRQEGVTHLIAERLIDRTRLLGKLLTRSRDFH
jgi:error-prone DNA polymerase